MRIVLKAALAVLIKGEYKRNCKMKYSACASMYKRLCRSEMEIAFDLCGEIYQSEVQNDAVTHVIKGRINCSDDRYALFIEENLEHAQEIFIKLMCNEQQNVGAACMRPYAR